jgi:hypothetical protein
LKLKKFIYVICSINHCEKYDYHQSETSDLESLSSLDQAQTAKVLDYIKGLLYSRDDLRHQVLKHEALKEIRQALAPLTAEGEATLKSFPAFYVSATKP